MRRGFTIHHNGPPASCVGRPHSRCIQYWEAVKDFHVRVKGWSGIAYSFGMCPHGIRFVGQGWSRPQFANGSDVVGADDGRDSEWYSVLVFLGWELVDGQPVDEIGPPAMVAGVKELIDAGRHYAYCGDQVRPHNAFKIKRCPGAQFTRLAAEWDGRPFTAPPPPPYPILEEDDMPYIMRAPGHPTRIMGNGTAVPVSTITLAKNDRLPVVEYATKEEADKVIDQVARLLDDPDVVAAIYDTAPEPAE